MAAAAEKMGAVLMDAPVSGGTFLNFFFFSRHDCLSSLFFLNLPLFLSLTPTISLRIGQLKSLSIVEKEYG